MFVLICTLLLVVLFAWQEQRRIEKDLRLGYSRGGFHVWYWAIIVLLLIVFGFRKGYNDTSAYIRGFTQLDANASWANLGTFLKEAKYPGFSFAMLLLKRFVSEDPQIFVFVFTLVYVWGFAWLYRKTAPYFHWTFYIFMASGTYLFGLAAIKQITAMAFWYIGYILFTEKKYLRSVLAFAIAPTFHIYALLLFVLLFLQKKTWTLQTLFFIVIAIVVSSSVDRLISVSAAVTDLFGTEYDMADLISDKQGMNIFRVLLYAVVPVMSLVMRGKVNRSGSRFVIVGCNAAVITFSVMSVATVGGANAIGRVAYYFAPLSWVALPWLMKQINSPTFRAVVTASAAVLFFIFFAIQYANYTPFIYFF